LDATHVGTAQTFGEMPSVCSALWRPNTPHPLNHRDKDLVSRMPGIIPELIVVGVTHRDRVRDLYATRADFTRNGQLRWPANDLRWVHASA
jgi:hypothetical protein